VVAERGPGDDNSGQPREALLSLPRKLLIGESGRAQRVVERMYAAG